MTFELAILDVGNADSIVLLAPGDSAIIIDVPKPRLVLKWLEGREKSAIDCIYFTHAHQDHLPSLSSLKTFIADWLKRGSLQVLCLPTEAIRNARKLVHGDNIDAHTIDRVRDALDRIDLWDQERAFSIIRGERGASPQRFGQVSITVLHPSFLYFEAYNAAYPGRLNETSLVLRVEYGEFCALLLADIEKDGLSSFLEHCEDKEIRCHIVKIPHHGAWQGNESNIRALLERVDAELAVLSVGSKNQHGHVMPQLFGELLRLKEDTSKRLKGFVCTELTRTCVCSLEERLEMGKTGLSGATPCAGDVVISAKSTGNWEMLNRDRHIRLVEDISHAACFGRADLRDSKEHLEVK